MAFELGSRVEVKFAGDKRRICRVVKAQRKVVYITSDALYERAKAQGTKREALIGVPRRDVSPA
jgi:hypothetical protein